MKYSPIFLRSKNLSYHPEISSRLSVARAILKHRAPPRIGDARGTKKKKKKIVKKKRKKNAGDVMQEKQE